MSELKITDLRVGNWVAVDILNRDYSQICSLDLIDK